MVPGVCFHSCSHTSRRGLIPNCTAKICRDSPVTQVVVVPKVNGWDMTMVTHDQARKRLTKRNEEVVRLLVTRHSLQKAVQQSMLSQPCH
uniref:Tax1 binding protein 3 n=1 Tax=Pseudonaja textilis TaxID=8673 RepID=A0A670YIC8_PSETE